MKISIYEDELWPYYGALKVEENLNYPTGSVCKISVKEWKDYLDAQKKFKKWQDKLALLQLEMNRAEEHKKKEEYMKSIEQLDDYSKNALEIYIKERG
jgi:hypothetical protein